MILERLQQEDLVVDGVSPNFLVRNWPPALPEWSTKAVRDAFFASPKFPRLLNADAVKQTICRGVEAGMMAYVVKETSGKYDPFMYRESLSEADLEVTDDVFLISKEAANAYIEGRVASEDGQPSVSSPDQPKQPGGEPREAGITGGSTSVPPAGTMPDVVPGFRWTGILAPQKWMNFYTKVLARLADAKGLTLSLTVDVQPESGISKAKITEMKVALRELGMSEDVHIGDTHDSGRTGRPPSASASPRTYNYGQRTGTKPSI